MEIAPPSTPANFRTDLASRSVTAPSIRRPAAGSPVAVTRLPPPQQQQHEEPIISFNSTDDTGDFSIPQVQVPRDHLPPAITSSQQYYIASQYSAPPPPPSTPQKQVFTYSDQQPEFTFARSGYSPQRTPLPSTRRRPPITVRPMTPRLGSIPTFPLTGQSGYFSSSAAAVTTTGDVRPRTVGTGSAVVSASGGRAGSPAARVGAVGSATRGYEGSTGTGRGRVGEDFVAGLTAHGGRR